MLDVLDVMTRLGEVKNMTAEALRATEADTGASVVTVAVVREFDKKADKANRQPKGDKPARDSVIELEQAGDSAKAAVEQTRTWAGTPSRPCRTRTWPSASSRPRSRAVGYYTEELQGPHEIFELGDFTLESG